MDRKMVNFIKEQYPPGTRIRLNSMEDPYAPVAPGTEGVVDFVDDIGTIHMKWDNGRSLGIVPGEDSFSVLPPKLTTFKLYMPLTAELYERSEYGDLELESTELDGSALRSYQDQIMAELVKNRMPEETERGLMHWYGIADSVNTKVHSAVFTVEERDRQLWGVAECRIAGELNAAEMDTLKEYIAGQASDGWGEHFEQREILVDGGSELYVHLWNAADSQFFNGHTNITSSRFLVFGVKSLLMAGRNIQNAMLFNILSYMSDKLLTEGNTVATLDELYIWLSNPTAIEYIRNCLKRVRKKESAMILASQNLDDFDQPNVREMTKPLFSIPPHQFLFNAGSIDKRSYMDMLQLEESEYDLIRYPQRGVCLYKCGNERYLLEVHAPPHKEALFGTAGGR